MEFPDGEKHVLVPIDRLRRLEKEIAAFRTDEALNGFQRWIVGSLYRFRVPETGFDIRSIFLIAIPHPLYSRVTFARGGRKYASRCLVVSDFGKTDRALKTMLRGSDANIVQARDLPLKRLAVQSGLAVYGRNNITYIPGRGSNFSYAAYFTDIACAGSEWRSLGLAPSCAGCSVCLKACPTGAIREDRFLIDTDRCLSYLNESGAPFPEWLDASVHHTVYDCLKCQLACPLNRDQANKTGRDIDFDEDETGVLLAGTRYEQYPQGMREKTAYLGMDQWPQGIAKTLKILTGAGQI